ncbi:sacsin-like isoform X1 [Orbicella faveolata]|uniref:sacsin-like isoform X1 n=1 Tax=Orbicella faveolata TaxID=48498 RepID=UPI0009E47EB0|nr:sacsin-like isoform X1 [Orbicella faveolata]
MYKDIEKMRRKFPDVFPCYLEDLFSIQNSTMFRLPLRTKEMAQISEISSAAVTVKKLDEMMEDLKEELFDILLFVNNVKKISLCGIDESSGKLTDRYSVEVLLSEDDDKKRKAFADCIKGIGNRAKESNNSLPTSVNVQKCLYTMKLRDSFGREETWLIVQQVGFKEAVDKSVVDAFRKQKLGMLPRGGVACLLESTNSREQRERKKKAYCFLPLPLETDLPVHINGHFALDHEARRNLWRDVTGDYRTDWNNALLRDVIASCYLTLLDGVRAFLHLPIVQDRAESRSESRSNCRSTTLRKLSTYEELFPRLPIEDTYWKTLVEAVYQVMSKKGMRLIPLVRKAEENSSRRREESYGSERVQVEWFPLSGTGKDKIYFNNLEIKGCFAAKPPKFGLESKEEKEERKRREEGRIKRKSKFEETLLETDLKLVAFSMTTFESLKKAEVEVVCLSPTAVMDFYKSFSDPDPLCHVGKIPCPVNKTPFKNEQGVIRVLKYCKDDDHFLKNLSGLPLLLTEDNNLNAFSESNPRCLSRYQNIFPCSPSIFVHREVRSDIFSSPECVKSPVFRPLDVQMFASLLHETLPYSYISEDHYVKWCPDDPSATLPNHQWIYRVWSFLQEFVNDAMTKAEITEDCKEEFIRTLLSPLSKWCLLPATKTIHVERSSTSFSSKTVVNKRTLTDHFLVPLGMAETVLDFSDCGISDRNLATIVGSLGLPKVNSVVITTIYLLTTPYTKPDSYQFVRNLVASLKTPKSLLTALKQALETDPLSLEGKLQPSHATVVLEYFNRNVQSLTDVDKEILRKLPFYPTARGGLAKLEERKSCIIPDELPEEEMDVVESVLDCLFLKSNSSLSDLYEFLDVESVSPVEAYLEFVFKCFPYFSEEGTLAHIRYICQFHYSGSSKQKNEREIGRQKLLDYLKTVKLIPNKDGTLMTTSSFCDPRNPVFKSMLTEDEFPPDPFASEEWLPFLEMIGLVQNVSKDDFQRFATEVAHEAATKRNKNTFTRSRILVDHLISRPNVVGEGLLQMVCDIPFVAADPVTEPLLTVCRALGATMDGEVPFIAFKGAVFKDYEDIVWTKAHLLPGWADPRSRQYEFDRPHGVNIEQYCNSFLAQLQIVKKPSVNLVVSHCENICIHFERKSKIETASREQCSAVKAVMESIYAFLQDNATTGNEAKRVLETTPCILVEEGRRFILPSQAVLELYESLEIKPYLYKIPPDFGKFQRLFGYLGCSKAVGATHYAMVLEMLRESSRNDNLHQNELRMCSKAVKGFLARLQDHPDEASAICNLYLPATFPEYLYLPAKFPETGSSDKPLKQIPVTLHKSTELVFNDVPAYGPRIARLNIRFVLELSLLDVRPTSAMTNYEELMMKLPVPLQPVTLSSVVKEKLTDGVIVTSGAVNALMTRLLSAQFVRGIVRIIRHVDSQKKQFDEGIAADIENGLRNIELCAVESLKTSLFHNGQLIPGSEDYVPYLQEKVVASGKEKLKVYLNSVTGMSDAISATSQVIEEIYGERLGKKMVLIPEMLRCPLGDIWLLLNSRRIRRDDTYDGSEIGIYAEPGGFIPIEEHHLLNDAFLEFEPGEYVGYQLHDPSLQLGEGVATYIYAIIIKEVEVIDEDAILLTKMYQINIGFDREPIEVNAAVLHKFHRIQDISEREKERPRNRNREVIFQEISGQLKDAWRLPEEQKRQIVKRLILRWHPEKNLGDEEFCSEAFEHIKNAISQLGGSYDDYIDAWVTRAIEHGTRREEYRERLANSDRSWESSSCHMPPRFCIRNPQPEEAKRWFRQAEADLAAGANEIDSSRPSYEWACFKCHQAAEKALKAAQYMIHADKTSDHNLVQNCSGLNDSELISFASGLETLVVRSARMRYPDQVSFPKIPNEVYSAQMADQAFQLSENILMRVKDRIP